MNKLKKIEIDQSENERQAESITNLIHASYRGDHEAPYMT